MTRPSAKKPTPAELEILQVLWRKGPATVRAVHEELGAETGYTTILKLMQIMIEKGLLKRDTAERSHTYEPAIPEEQTQKRLVHDLIEKAFRGSARALVLQALSSRKTSREELAEIRRAIEQIEKGEK